MRKATKRAPQRQQDPVTAYARAVVMGKRVANRLVRLACQRHLEDLKRSRSASFPFRFDRAKAQEGIDFFPKCLKHTTGEWADQPLRLSDWQQFVTGSLHGWLRKGDGLRKFSTSYTEVPRKNGKSTWAAGIAVQFTFLDGEQGAQGYCAATKRDQARIVWGDAAKMIAKSPELRARIMALTRNLHHPKSGSKLEPLGADLDSLDGLNPHVAVVDELHAHKSAKLIEVLDEAMGARRQPLLFVITTAGWDRTSVCWQYHQHSVEVLEGRREDPAWFAFIATIDEGKDWRDESEWGKANPNLGISVKLEGPKGLRRQAQQAEQIPAKQNTFRRMRLCEWTEQAERWVDMALWDSCAGTADEVQLRALRGRECFAGLDLASTSDINALVLLFPPTREEQQAAAEAAAAMTAAALEARAAGAGGADPEAEEEGDGDEEELDELDELDEEEGEEELDEEEEDEEGDGDEEDEEEEPLVKLAPGLWRCLCRFWLPEAAIEQRREKAGVPYPVWKQQGLLRSTPGNVVDYAYIRAEIAELAERVRIREVGYDRWNASQLVTDLMNDGASMVPVGLGFASMNTPMQQLERLLKGGQLRHGGNEVLRWMAGNLATEQDPAGNLKPSKRKSAEKIDGMVALLLALSRAIVDRGQGGTIYSQRGIRRIG